MEKDRILKKEKINAINLTAYRAIKILRMLIEKPCSHSEIIENLKNDEITERSISDDTLRATINSLKAIGCDISRPAPNNNYKYFLNKNDWKTVIELNELYNKIGEFSKDNRTKELLNSNKPFLRIRADILEHLRSNDIENKEIIMFYATSCKKQNSIKVKVDKIFCYAGKIYLWVWYYERNKYSYLNTEKIVSIDSIKPVKEDIQPKFYTATYKVYGEDFKTFKKEEEEKVIKTEKDSITVEYEVRSEFKFIQRMLNFGENFEIIEPVYVKKILFDKIKKMFERYKDE